MSEQLPPSPYDLGEYVEEEPWYCKNWTVRLYERARPDAGQRIEVDAWTFTDKAEAEAHGDKVIEDPDLDHDHYLYTVVIDEDLQKCEEPDPDPDPDNRPGGHDDY